MPAKAVLYTQCNANTPSGEDIHIASCDYNYGERDQKFGFKLGWKFYRDSRGSQFLKS